MALFLLGTHYKTAPIAIREKLHFSRQMLPAAYGLAKKYGFAPIILSTCNRVEIYVYTSGDAVSVISKKILSWMEEVHGIAMPKEAGFYRISKTRAHAHLCETASGLKSLVVGENQVLGQVKTAYKEACQHIKIPNQLGRAFEMAIACGKKVRTATNIGKGAMSLGSVTLDLIREVYGNDEELRVCVVGAGEIAEEVLSKLINRTSTQVAVVNRTKANANKLMKKFAGLNVPLNFMPWGRLYKTISSAQLVITSTSSNGKIINCSEYEEARNKIRFTFFLDLGVPRNVDEKIANLPDVALYTIDDLQRIVTNNAAMRGLEVDRAKEIVDEKVEELNTWLGKQHVFEEMKKSVKNMHSSKKTSKKVSKYLEKMKEQIKKLKSSNGGK